MNVKRYRFSILHPISDNYVYFNALVNDSDTYDIYVDKFDLFSETFKEIISGKFVLYTQKKYEEVDNKYDIDSYFTKYPINKGNAIDNLREYIELCKEDSHRYILEEVPFSNIIEVSFSGPSFNYEHGMNPTEFSKANNFLSGFTKIINDLNGEEQYVLQKAGSVIYEIHTPDSNELNNKLKNYLLSILNNNFSNIKTDEKEIVYNFFKLLYHVKNIKNLNGFKISFNGEKPIDIDINKIVANSRQNFKIIKIYDVPDKFSHEKNNFYMGKYSCYIPDDLVDRIDYIKDKIIKRESVTLKGKINPIKNKTLFVTEIIDN